MQSLWVKHFSSQLWAGEVYPRWLNAFFAGRGSPVFFYYPPLAYYAASLFAALIPLDDFGFYAMTASSVFAVALSGMAFYVWAKEETAEPRAALLGSLLYMAAPYHVAQNFYHLISLGCVWSYVSVPLLLLFARRLMQSQPFSIPGFAFSLTLLVMSNLPMTLLFGPLAMAYACIFLRKDRWKSQLSRLALALLLGFGLSAIYLLPMLFYLPFVNVEYHWASKGTDGGVKSYDVASYFFTSLNRTDGTLYKLYLTAAGMLLIVYGMKASKEKRKLFFLIVLAGCLFMMLPFSAFVWKLLPILKILQYAERLFAVTALAFAALAVLLYPQRKRLGYVLLVIYIIATWLIAAGTRISIQEFKEQHPDKYEQYTLNIDQYPEYLTTPNLIQRYGTKEGLATVKAAPLPVQVVTGDAEVMASRWQPRDILIHYRATMPSLLRVRQFDYPGFMAVLEGKELPKRREESTGEILLDVPPGEGDIRLNLKPLLPEIAGRAVSLFCACILLLMILWQLRRKGT